MMPKWLRDEVPEGAPVLLLPEWLEVEDILLKLDKGKPKVGAVNMLHRIVLRHELTHYIRWKKGHFDYSKPRPWLPLVVLREEVIANLASLRFIDPRFRKNFIPFVIAATLGSTMFGLGDWKHVLWLMSCGLLGKDVRTRLRASADKLTEKPPGPQREERERTLWHWQRVYPWCKPYVTVIQDTYEDMED